MEVVTRWWLAFANAVGDFFEEAIFRLALAFHILLGRVPQRTNKRPWIRSVETPVLVVAATGLPPGASSACSSGPRSNPAQRTPTASFTRG